MLLLQLPCQKEAGAVGDSGKEGWGLWKGPASTCPQKCKCKGPSSVHLYFPAFSKGLLHVMVERARNLAIRDVPSYSQVALVAPVKQMELAPVTQAHLVHGKSNRIIALIVVFNFKS